MELKTHHLEANRLAFAQNKSGTRKVNNTRYNEQNFIHSMRRIRENIRNHYDNAIYSLQ